MKNVFEIKYNNNYIQFGSVECAREIAIIMIELKKRGVKVGKYTDLEKGWMIFFSVFVIVMGGLIALPYLT